MSRVKKLGLFFILLFIFICVAIGVLILKIEYFDPYNSVNYSEMIDTEIPKNAKVLDYKDTHGGFLGDGDLYAVIQFDKNEKNSFLKNIEKNKKWKKTPLQKDLKLIIYGGELKKDGNYYVYEPLPDYNIPKTKNGIYYFKDRFAENYPEDADTNINDRAAYNITFALFDLDTNKLYIYKLDT